MISTYSQKHFTSSDHSQVTFSLVSDVRQGGGVTYSRRHKIFAKSHGDTLKRRLIDLRGPVHWPMFEAMGAKSYSEIRGRLAPAQVEKAMAG